MHSSSLSAVPMSSWSLPAAAAAAGEAVDDVAASLKRGIEKEV